MAQGVSPFGFVQGRPCITFDADGLSSVQHATCLIDCGGEYEALLYRHTTSSYRFTMRLPNVEVVLPDGRRQRVKQAYLGITWLGYRKHVVVRRLFAMVSPQGAVPNNGFTGFVGDRFFAAHEVRVDHQNGQVHVNPVANPPGP